MKKLYYGLVCFLLLAQVIPCFVLLVRIYSVDKVVVSDGSTTTSSWILNDFEFVNTPHSLYNNVFRFYSNIRGTPTGLIFESSDELNEILFGHTYFDTLSEIDNNDTSDYGFYVPIMHFIWSLPLFIFIHIFLSFFFWIMSKFDPY